MMVVALVFLLAFSGFTLLAADMKHKKELGSAQFNRRQLLCCRVLGIALLLLSFTPCLTRWSYFSTGFAAWIGMAGLSAVSLGLCFTYAPRLVEYLKAAVALAGRLGNLLPAAQKTA